MRPIPLYTRLFCTFAAIIAALVIAAPLIAQQPGPNVYGAGTYGPTIGSQGSHMIAGGGPPPALNAGCGTGAAIQGTDSAFHILTGTGTSPGTDCVVTFAAPWNNRPTCIVAGEQNAIGFFITPPSTMNLHSVVDSQRYHVHCFGRPGG